MESASPDKDLSMDRVWKLFDSYYPSGQFKKLFSEANKEKVKVLEQDTSLGLNMTCHKLMDKTSFTIPKKKKKVVETSKTKSSKPSSSKQTKITDMVQKKKDKPGVSAGVVEDSASEESASESGETSEEDIDEKLKNFIQAGFYC